VYDRAYFCQCERLQVCLGATITRTSGQGFSTTSFFFSPQTQQAFIKTIGSRTVTGSSFSASQSLNFSAKLSETEIVVLLLKKGG
jgi:hypothetical protein